MKPINILLICIILIILAGSAGASLNVTEILPDAMATGFDQILRDQADNLLEMAGLTSVNQSTMIANIMIAPNDIIENSFVQENKDFPAYYFQIFMILFLIFGGIKVLDETNNPDDDDFGRTRNTWRKYYLTVAITSLIIYSSYLWIFKQAFDMEYAFSYGLYLQTVDLVSQSSITGTSYFIHAFIWILQKAFGEYRYIILSITVVLFLIAYLFNFLGMGSTFWTIIYYFIILLFGRTLLVLVIWAGSGILAASHVFPLSPMTYTILISVDIILMGVLITYPIWSLLFRRQNIKYIIM